MQRFGNTFLGLVLLGGLMLCLSTQGYATFPQKVNSSDLINRIAAGKGKVVLIHFWATWCSACRQEIPALNELRTRYSTEELLILGVAMDQDPQAVKRYVEKREIDYALVVAQSSVGLDFRVTGVPKTLIYKPSGELAFQGFGYLPGEKLHKTVARIIGN